MKSLKITNETFFRFVFGWAYLHYLNSDKFRSSLRLAIYVLFKDSIIDLRETPSKEITTTSKLLELVDRKTSFKIKKKHLLKYMDLSNNTFNKLFSNYLNENNLNGRRSYTLLEIYQLLVDWKGDLIWYRITAFTKKELAYALTNDNYRELSLKFDTFILSNSSYKENDKLSPQLVESFLKSLDFDKEKIENIFLPEV